MFNEIAQLAGYGSARGSDIIPQGEIEWMNNTSSSGSEKDKEESTDPEGARWDLEPPVDDRHLLKGKPAPFECSEMNAVDPGPTGVEAVGKITEETTEEIKGLAFVRLVESVQKWIEAHPTAVRIHGSNKFRALRSCVLVNHDLRNESGRSVSDSCSVASAPVGTLSFGSKTLPREYQMYTTLGLVRHSCRACSVHLACSRPFLIPRPSVRQ